MFAVNAFDALGRKVLSKDIFVNAGDARFALNISSFPPGIYTMEITAGQNRIFEKLVVN